MGKSAAYSHRVSRAVEADAGVRFLEVEEGAPTPRRGAASIGGVAEEVRDFLAIAEQAREEPSAREAIAVRGAPVLLEAFEEVGAPAAYLDKPEGVGGLRTRLQRTAMAASYRAVPAESPAWGQPAAAGTRLLPDLDAAVQRDARRYDGGFERF